ncbi:MAG: serine/threonine-protein kinase [Paludisphaera borealis]|uniref:serine/threonine-protein kinase n=1 Tax=Paludisphaera borealis TaxID=1387353 RepID=UPI002841CCF7|nr:serine/threonine-protein kinase [Paludisphaera borealis]MDR3618255.1 serine/threonine-protein kinase [Paludisphaera borealis]
MAIDIRVSELLEELHDSGRTPEEVCGDFPELLPELRVRWRRVCRLEAELDSIFPPEREEPERPSASSPGAANLPRIPGYEVESLLGRGGMGVVFRARHVRLNRIVAIKLAIAGAYAAPRERERFQREAEAVAALRHANVVQIYDVGDSEGRPYFTMEFIAGGSLAEAAKPTTPRQAASILLALSGALQSAHTAGIIHRDLKPANILLDEDGTPKISDFGLSRRIDDAASLTLNGAVIGTPSYMAPEQAAGDRTAVGAAVDIYALGAILYELLTGRPPFRGETSPETIRQTIHSDPPPPSRLNSKIPRDLEIICLKCLSKDPSRRYASAVSLGSDLQRFLDGEAIEAKPEGRIERLWRKVRRNPGYAMLLACVVLLAAILACVGLWLAAERAEMGRRAATEGAADERAAEVDLRDMAREMARGALAEARTAFDRAQGRLGRRGSTDLREALVRGRRDLDMAARFEAIRMGRARTVGGVVDDAGTDEAYAQAFRGFGLGGPDEAPEAVAARIRASNARRAVVDALDDWPITSADIRRKEWVLQVARLSAGEESGWIRDARDPEVRRSRQALERLIEKTPAAAEPVTLLLALAEDLRATGGDPIPLLTRVQRARPGDFWANLTLGSALGRAGRHADAIRYQQAALSIRPDAAIGYNNLGHCLADSGRPGDAAEYFRSALRLDPTAAVSSYNLGFVLRITGKPNEAIEVVRSGLRANPSDALLHAGLGDSLAAAARHVEAFPEYRQAVSIDPRLAVAQAGLRTTLIRLGRSEEAQAAWRLAIEADPRSIQARDGYAEFCLFLGHEDDYREERRILLERFDGVSEAQPAERIGRACLLLPASREETERAAILIDRALADRSPPPPAWTRPYFLLAKGLAEYRLDRLDDSISTLQGEAATVMGPCPRMIVAMAQHRLGRKGAAAASLSSAIQSHDWASFAPDSREAWIYHALRREAESLIGPVTAASSAG